MMLRWIVICGFFLLPFSLFGQFEGEIVDFYAFDHQGTVFGEGEMAEIEIVAKRPGPKEIKKGQRKLARFTRLRWNVHKTYPYAVGISQLVVEVHDEMESLPNKKAKRQFIKAKEATLFGAYEDDLRKMSRKQGLVLIKLVHRESGNSAFSLIKDMKSGISAVFWQGISRIFGMNLKDEYDFEEEQMIEEIVAELEGGGYNIVYKKYNFYFASAN